MGHGIPSARLDGAIQSVREAIAAAAQIDCEKIGPDEDFVDDLILDELELESLGLILEEVFAVDIPDRLFASPLYRTASALADWLIRHSDQAAWQAARIPQQRRRA